MLVDTLGDHTAKINWHRITDEFSDMRYRCLVAWLHKLITVGESLEPCSLAKGDGPVLLWVTKATIAKSDAVGSHRW